MVYAVEDRRAEAAFSLGAAVPGFGIPFGRGFLRARGPSFAAVDPLSAGLTQLYVGLRGGLREVLAEGASLEAAHRSHLVANLGETIIPGTQFQHGAALRGFDSASFSGTGSQARLFLDEVKNVTGRVRGSKLTVFGLGWGGNDVFDKAIDHVRHAIVAAGLDDATTFALQQQLRNRTATIRLIGNSAKGTRFSDSVIERVRYATGFQSVTGFNL